MDDGGGNGGGSFGVKHGSDAAEVTYVHEHGTWWRHGGALAHYSQPEGRGFDYRSSRHVGTLGKSFTCSCLCASA